MATYDGEDQGIFSETDGRKKVEPEMRGEPPHVNIVRLITQIPASAQSSSVQEGGQASNPGQTFLQGTAYLLAPDSLPGLEQSGYHYYLTAAHNVCYCAEGDKSFQPANEIKMFLRGEDEGSDSEITLKAADYGSGRRHWFMVHPSYKENITNHGERAKFDMAVIALHNHWVPPTCFEGVGFFTINFKQASNAAAKDLLEKPKEVTISGYPVYFPSEARTKGKPQQCEDQLYHSHDSKDVVLKAAMWCYRIDTDKGQSGSPIYSYSPDSSGKEKYVVIGTHSRRDEDHNEGVPLTTDEAVAACKGWQ